MTPELLLLSIPRLVLREENGSEREEASKNRAFHARETPSVNHWERLCQFKRAASPPLQFFHFFLGGSEVQEKSNSFVLTNIS